MANIKISELPKIASANENDLILLTKILGEASQSAAITIKNLATSLSNDLLSKTNTYSTLTTTDKTIIGAINEVNDKKVKLVRLGNGTCAANFNLTNVNDYNVFWVVTSYAGSTSMPTAECMAHSGWQQGTSYVYDNDYRYSTSFIITSTNIQFSRSWCGGKYGTTTITPADINVWVYGIE